MPPNEVEKKVLDFIREYTQNNGYGPSNREIQDALGFKSLHSLHRCLLSLRESGKVTWEQYKSRTLRITDGREASS